MLIWALRNKSDERRKSRKSAEQPRLVSQGAIVCVLCDLLVVKKAKYPFALQSIRLVECSCARRQSVLRWP